MDCYCYCFLWQCFAHPSPQITLGLISNVTTIQYLLELLHGQRYTIQVVHKEQYQPVRMHSYPS